MKTKLLSIFLSILLLTSFFTPVVNAEPIGFIPVAAAAAAPEACEIIIAGMTVIISGAVVVEIGEHLGKIWDKNLENWDRFVKSVSAGLDTVFAAKNWVKITSQEGEAAMKALYECYCADVPPGGGKKDDKWYFEARRSHGKVEINTERMNEEQALKEMSRGKHIMTLNRELAKKLVGRFKGLTEMATKGQLFDGYHDPAAGKFLHLHYIAHEMRLHCWIWKDI